jgi:hypothetical protein
MLIDKLKICLGVLLLLSGLYVVSYAGNTPNTGEYLTPDSNSVQTEVPQSNTADVNGIKETVSGQNGGMADGNSQADQSAVQKDSNLATERVVDQNATQVKPAKVSSSDQEEWSRWITGKMIAIYIVLGLAVTIIVAWLLLRQTLRTRIRMKKIMIEDPDIDDFLIAFDWTSKVLYFPTMIASIVAANLMYLQEADVWFFSSINPKIIGSAWFTIFFLNFIIEEYNITIIMMITSLISIGFLFLWLNLVGWVSGFLKLFKHLALSISATGYLLVSIIGLLTILISWLKGLFYYVTITPNYMNLQEGPTETGEQIGREDYNTRIDTSDFFGRLLGFGKIIITFKDKKRQPIVLRVSNIRNKAQLLERVRAKLVIDHKLRSAIKSEPEPQNPA